MNGWDLPEIRVPRGGIKFDALPSGGAIVAAGGWCAPSEDVFKMFEMEDWTDAQWVDYYQKQNKALRKRAEKAERKLRKLRKIMEESK